MAHVQNRFGIELPFTPTTRVIPERTAQGTEAPPSAGNARPVVNVDASYAGNVYDCAVSTLQHGRNLCMHTEKHSAEIGCRNTIEVFNRHFHECALARNAGIINRVIETAILLLCDPHHLLYASALVMSVAGG